MCLKFPRVPLQLGQIVERVGARELADMDQAHERVSHFGAVQRLVKQRILTMQYSPALVPLTDVVIQRRSGFAQKRR